MGFGRGWHHGVNLNVTRWNKDNADIVNEFVGGTQQMTAKATVNEERCIGCGVCENVCRTGAIKVLNGVAKVDVKKCIGCGDCVTLCPQDAISLKAE
ncbi:MAG: 4Fe-4S binding protein [bacterium]|nr:4Fe-4S binding protein [bacterium]